MSLKTKHAIVASTFCAGGVVFWMTNNTQNVVDIPPPEPTPQTLATTKVPVTLSPFGIVAAEEPSEKLELEQEPIAPITNSAPIQAEPSLDETEGNLPQAEGIRFEMFNDEWLICTEKKTAKPGDPNYQYRSYYEYASGDNSEMDKMIFSDELCVSEIATENVVGYKIYEINDQLYSLLSQQVTQNDDGTNTTVNYYTSAVAEKIADGNLTADAPEIYSKSWTDKDKNQCQREEYSTGKLHFISVCAPEARDVHGHAQIYMYESGLIRKINFDIDHSDQFGFPYASKVICDGAGNIISLTHRQDGSDYFKYEKEQEDRSLGTCPTLETLGIEMLP